MIFARGRWLKNNVEVNEAFLTMLPREFDLELGVEKIKVINKQRLGRLLLDSFYLPQRQNIIIKKEGSSVKLGPILAILARGLTQKRATLFKPYFHDDLSTLLYVVDETQLKNSQWEGYLFNENWHYLNLPRPEFLFNRTYPTDSRNEDILPQTVLFNPITQFSKYMMTDLLKKSGIEVPESFSGNFIQHYRRYPLIYLKPDRGSFGRGIYVIKKIRDGYHVLSAEDETYSFYSNAEIIRLLERLEREGYILQEGLEGDKYHGEPIDFRVHVLIDPNPRIALLAARTSQHDFLFTSRPKQLFLADDVLSKEDKVKLNNLVFHLTEVLKKSLGYYVEFSIDVVKNQYGRFTVIDLNGKSTRTHAVMLDKDLKPYFRAPIRLAEHLFLKSLT